VYVASGSLPPRADEQAVGGLFAAALEKIGGCTAGPGPAVLNVYINPEKRFAFVEFRAVAEASNAMALNGALFRGVELIVRRPNDYNLAAAVALGNHTPAPSLDLEAVGLAPLGGPDNRIFVGGLPPYIGESHCKELLEFFGAVKRFALHSDPISGDSLGFGLAIFEDPSVSDVVCEALRGIKMGGGELQVRRVAPQPPPGGPPPHMMHPPPPGALAGPPQLPPGVGAGPPPGFFPPPTGPGFPRGLPGGAPTGASRVVSLTNCVTPEDLADPEELQGIQEDMHEEGSKYGPLLKVVIPQGPPPGAGGALPPGYLKVFLQFGDVAAAARARQAMAGRKFGGKVVEALFVDEEMFRIGAL